MKKFKYIDLSHTIEHGLITYKGLPAPIICDYLSREESKKHYQPGTEFQIGKIEMVANTGTYIDTPFHRYENGRDLSEILIKETADLEGVKITVDGNKVKSIDETFFQGIALQHKAVLIQTGWSVHWNTDNYFENHPHLTKNAAEYLKENKAALVGIDSLNIDDTSGNARPVHSVLLKAEIPIVEHMCNLDQLPSAGFRFSALAPKIKGMGSFPVRAYASIPKD